MHIVPIRDLKDTVKIENLCSETMAPVFITKNGYGRLVVMDIECYENLINQINEAKIINEGIEDYNNNKLVEGKKALEDIKQKHGL